MHGPGSDPRPSGRPPAPATLIVVRVLFVILALLSCGLLAWGTMLRLAIVRRRPLDWALFWVALVLAIATLAVVGEFSSQDEPPRKEPATAGPLDLVFVGVTIAMALGVPVHYLVADIRHHRQPAAPGWGGPPSPYTATAPSYTTPPPHTPGYGYPPAQSPTGPPVPNPAQNATPPPARHPVYSCPQQQPVRRAAHPVAPPSQPQPQTPPPPPYSPQPHPAPPPPEKPRTDQPRIDQVRAELDELSDYLRKERGR